MASGAPAELLDRWIEGSVGLGLTQGGLRNPRLSGFNISFAWADNNGVLRHYNAIHRRYSAQGIGNSCQNFKLFNRMSQCGL